MTTIKIRKTPLGRKIEIKGHSTDSSGDGKIVCAAVSTVTQTLAEYLTQSEENGKADIIDITLKSGYSVIDYIADDEEVNIGVDAICCGYQLLSQAFEERVALDDFAA